MMIMKTQPIFHTPFYPFHPIVSYFLRKKGERDMMEETLLGDEQMSIYDLTFRTKTGEEKSLSEYRGKVLLIVNTASKCGFTPQYEELQRLYERYNDNGLEILAFPSNQFMNQEPGTDDEIQQFCQLNYGVTFPVLPKTDVKGENKHPIFEYLTEQAPGALGTKAIKWNFTKFLINRTGDSVKRFSPQTKPSTMITEIEQMLQQ